MNLISELSVVATVSAFWLVAMIVPGLDFLLVTRLAVMRGKAAALRATFGVAVGVGIWGLAGFFGVRTLFIAAPWLYMLLKIVGGLYLFLTGFRLFMSSWQKKTAQSGHTELVSGTTRAFRAGLLTNLANPKAPVFVSGLFAAALPQHASVQLGLTCVAAMFVIAVAWFALVATLLSLESVSRIFMSFQKWIDRCAGLAFMALGLRFVTERSPG
ncbi:LysE family transporter [Acetobacter thailandicus]|uniref:LysE family transporter n=1 Tax=Acetobacter thailandicus TaxID=1502842 RepID=UPI001BA90248|nr:LysE family transporter [Acetobacter thailandicus]MBS0986594.1 LysE family transporter [Acetobacter thailandicus]MBS1003852.1 LysE family transporter [Acetobacter thailandicus]